ncbi:lipooligosaccharide transport system ATP-binding protein [Natronocella acetinitrilica]|uniref:Lipooligosaccharide transport system ATP-binding protein n=1 Tax=Natronocella acetinitrilica TaxID=414046 RepID=A0AAE3G6Z1_9GAMM|nr:ATP-binding cassette domain-containing protein [Natronocella acetinitrilica]MCP1677020.1 lipooligosaccharide transport system ATP-binding protein [Natronocella acetinitrilica]
MNSSINLVDAPAATVSAADAAIVTARGLTKRYGETEVVRGIDLDVRPGECFGLLGPNGAGKTTTLRMLLGLTPPTDGTLEVLGEPVPSRAREARVRIGIVPQADNLDPDFTVRENLVTYASYFGYKPAEVADRIDDLLRFANLEGRADSPIQALSGGMKRRLSLARALINDPALVVLDEPSTGLDPQARQHIWQRLLALLSRGCTLILTTHYMEEAERLCDRLAIVDDGRIVASGSPRELVAEHIEPHVFELRGADAERWHREGEQLADRAERVGDTLLLYAVDPEPVHAALNADASLRYWHRPANLEDVFLRLTGRDLRD